MSVSLSPARPGPLLRQLAGTAPFAAYCRDRGVAFDHPPAAPVGAAVVDRWAAALAALPSDAQGRVELDLLKVCELADAVGNAHLLAAAGEDDVPPDDVPAGAAVALWYLVHRPALFHATHLRREVRGLDTWRAARGPAGVVPADTAAAALAAALKAFFARAEGAGRFCHVEVHRAGDAVLFVAALADRPRLVEGFTEGGRVAAHRLRPAVPVAFAYSPADGRIAVRSRLRAADRVLGLVRLFGRAVLGAELGDDCLLPLYDLDRLRGPFAPLPDADDLEAVRVKAVHLRYPARAGRRVVKLETAASDSPAAVFELIAAHGGPDPNSLAVGYAELQVRLRTPDGVRRVVIRLWPDRCSLDQTPLGRRLRLLLRRWGLARD